MNKSLAVNNYSKLKPEVEKHIENLIQLVVASNEHLEGNTFYTHDTLEINYSLFTKQVNLFWVGSGINVNKMCEIGFNAGHSTLLLLLQSRAKEMLIFDICLHKYTMPCFEYIKNTFSDKVNMTMIQGDSIITMPEWIWSHPEEIETYDVVHVDGGHTDECIYSDMFNATRLLKNGGILVVDDTNFPGINNQVEIYIKTGYYKEIELLQTYTYPHRILQKIKSL